MILRRSLLRAASASPTAISAPTSITTRQLHHQIPLRPIPQPIPFIPDPPTFLTAIGRSLSAHSAKIPSWDALFTLSSAQLKDLGIGPARSRRYLLHWREKFRNGEYGIGGDCRYVDGGVANLMVVERRVEGGRGGRVTTTTGLRDVGVRRVVVNVPGSVAESIATDMEVGEEKVAGVIDAEALNGVKGVVIRGARTIKGPYVEPVKGSGGLKARIRMQEGIWEERRGHKVDGGERRRAEVRAKRRAAENKAKAR
ncbi:hypothetical protein P154DRAFT_520100 [Amniculicola lignicola CBS 123094]|uniref:Small ribosomal subunit protein mS41 n=1 Tax=Amniculicola lignicola CBS 123094 TaxID=1392246 RepID=A0A6A5WPP4_9PLEO|nr:hypothetical protein P154DRAFT_520100 [Amniculicola lignicola CBS 123094]